MGRPLRGSSTSLQKQRHPHFPIFSDLFRFLASKKAQAPDTAQPSHFSNLTKIELNFPCLDSELRAKILSGFRLKSIQYAGFSFF